MVQKIDATAPDQRELRNELLKIYRAATETTGVRYPLVFRVTGSRDDAKWEYVCTYEELHSWNECKDMTDDFKTFIDSVEPLWLKLEDAEGNTFYYNVFTTETAWAAPHEYIEPEQRDILRKHSLAPSSATSAPSSSTPAAARTDAQPHAEPATGNAAAAAAAAAQADAAQVPARAHEDEAVESKSTTADAEPEAASGAALDEPLQAAEANFEGEVGNIADWERHYDEEGDSYWHNSVLGTSSWYPPVGWAAYEAAGKPA